MKKKIIAGTVALLLVIQFFQPSKNRGEIKGTSYISHMVSIPPEVEQLLEKACFDCHSNNTVYPWYTAIQPAGWWMQHHVDEGKEELNFSEFVSYSPKRQKHKLDEIAEMVREKEMPLSSYTLIHQQAKLSADDAELIALWALHSKEELNNIPAEKPEN